MATFKELTQADIKTSKTFLNQIVDVLQEDVSASVSRKKYQHFVTGGTGPGVTSSLFQTVYDQDFTSQTANAIFDITLGLYANSTVVSSSKTGEDSSGKELFPSSSLMMREKMYMYRQFAAKLLGDPNSQFVAPYGSTSTDDEIDTAVFVCFKRLFSRDQIKRDTFAMQFYQSASAPQYVTPGTGKTNLYAPTLSGSKIYTDAGSAANKTVTFGGQVGNIVDASDTSREVGLLFYDSGIAVFDLNKIISGTQHATGTIDAVSAAGTTPIGSSISQNPLAKFIPDFVVSASIDNVLDHICGVRFNSGSITAMTFQNVTNINSTLVFCRADASEFNYSSNPTYTDDNNRIVVIDEGQEDTQQAFSFITSVGLYDANDNLLAVAKTSRPIEKNYERDLSLRVRLDF